MKIGITYYKYARAGAEKEKLANHVFSLLRSMGSDAELIESSQTPTGEHYDCIIAVGGDGMIFSAAQIFEGRANKYIGIVSQKDSLGVYCTSSWKTYKRDLEQLLSGKAAAHLKETFRTGARLGESKFRSAINEIALGPEEWGKMFEYELWIGNTHYSSGRSTSMIFATPKGSTAYALSAGGPVVDESLDAIVIVPESPNRPQMSNLLVPVTSRDRTNLLNAHIIPSEKYVKIKLKRASVMAIDGMSHLNEHLGENTELVIEKRPSIYLVSFRKP